MAITPSNRRRRGCGLGAVLLAVLGCLLAQPVAVAADEPPFLRVRSSDSTITTLIGLAATRSVLGLYNFFSRTASPGDNRFETVDAINAGNAVRRELSSRRTR